VAVDGADSLGGGGAADAGWILGEGGEEEISFPKNQSMENRNGKSKMNRIESTLLQVYWLLLNIFPWKRSFSFTIPIQTYLLLDISLFPQHFPFPPTFSYGLSPFCIS
jgi:hypothetical protein